jgi:molybdate transport system regulatory protein
MANPRVTIRLDFDKSNSIGPGKIALLERMQDSGSLSQAARELGMSYRRGWQLLASLNRSFNEPLVETAVGGTGGGGSTLTPLGRAMIHAYRAFEQQANRRAERQFRRFVLALSPNRSRSPRTPMSRSRSAVKQLRMARRSPSRVRARAQSSA